MIQNTHPGVTENKILLPVVRTERCLRILRVIRDFSPNSQTCEYLLLHVIENNADTAVAYEAYCDLKNSAQEILDGFRYRITVVRGNPAEMIRKLAVAHSFTLIALPYAQSSIQKNIGKTASQLVKTSPVPVLFLPDSFQLTGRSKLPKHISILCSTHNSDRPSLNKAFKICRYFACNTSIIFFGLRLHRGVIEQIINSLKLIYLNVPLRNKIHVDYKKTWRMSLGFEQVSDSGKTDLLIVCDAFSKVSFFRFRHGSLHRILKESSHPVLILRKKSEVLGMEKSMEKEFHQLSDFDLVQVNKNDWSEIGSETDYSSGDSKLFLGIYSRAGIEKALEHYGLIEELARIGYDKLRIDISMDSIHKNRIRFFPEKGKSDIPIIDIVMQRRFFSGFRGALPNYPDKQRDFLYIDWLLLQDPLRKFSDRKIPLPGQKFAGLGIGWKVMVILKLMGRRIGVQGLANSPQYYHTARIFHRYFHFPSPEDEGCLLAIDRDTYPYNIIEVSWAFEHGLVKETGSKNPQDCKWHGANQIIPFTPQLKSYFNSIEYRDAVLDVLSYRRFSIDEAEMKRLWEQGMLFQSNTTEGRI